MSDISQDSLTKNWAQIKHFKHQEFDSPDLPGSAGGMNLEFVKIIDQIRGKVGLPLHINSGFRTEAHNASVGGKSHSAHTLGLACDIACADSNKRYLIVKAAYEMGIKRIEIGDVWIHLDMDFTKPQEVMFFPDKK